MQKHWFVFYTKSRQEKKVKDLLDKRGFEAFLPMQTVVRQWTDRKKKVEVPLFNSYIFAFDFEHRIPEILQIPGLAWNIKHNGKPAVLRDDELATIKRFLSTGLTLEALPFDRQFLNAGSKARILDGPLKGQEGIVLGTADEETFNVGLESIDQIIRVKIPGFLLKKI
ncbi:MAG TPA: UpxY family transcription antiterminator [Chryseosolibacter sp.]